MSLLGASLGRSFPLLLSPFPSACFLSLSRLRIFPAPSILPTSASFCFPSVSNSQLQFTSQSFFHVDCFKCAKCGNQVTADTNLLLLSDGSPICANCSYSCNVCRQPILDEAIMTGDDSYHAHCFKCKVCKNRIDELVFAKTSQGIYCMNCHNQRVARSRRHAQRQREKEREREREREKAANALSSSDAAKAEQSVSVSEVLLDDHANLNMCASRALRSHHRRLHRLQHCLKRLPRLHLPVVLRTVGQCPRSIRRLQSHTHRMNLVDRKSVV